MKSKIASKISSFTITLEAQRDAYHGGEHIAGHLELVLNETLTFRRLSMKCHGEAYCRWTTGSGDDSKTHIGTEEFFNFVTVLHGSKFSDEVELPPGSHVFSFAYQLPLHLPTSYKDLSGGYIQYPLVGCIEFKGKSKHQVQQLITVREIIDINLPQYVGIVDTLEDKVVGCLCCVAGPVSLFAQVNRRPLFPGEEIYITSRCHNQSTRRIEAMKAKLVKVVTYQSFGDTDFTPCTVAKLEGPPIPPRRFAEWNNASLLIPSDAEPTITTCKVIQVTYNIIVSVDIPMSVDLHVELPVYIRNTMKDLATGENVAPGITKSNVPPSSYDAVDTMPPPYAKTAHPTA